MVHIKNWLTERALALCVLAGMLFWALLLLALLRELPPL